VGLDNGIDQGRIKSFILERPDHGVSLFMSPPDDPAAGLPPVRSKGAAQVIPQVIIIIAQGAKDRLPQ